MRNFSLFKMKPVPNFLRQLTPTENKLIGFWRQLGGRHYYNDLRELKEMRDKIMEEKTDLLMKGKSVVNKYIPMLNKIKSNG